MNDYAPASSLGWLDFDNAARDRVAETLRALEEPATLDVLGLGSVRDAFADMLSPGTSTVQTRLRYVVFVPWIFKRLEHDRVSAANFTGRLRDYEARLIECLRHLGRDQGVIGRIAGRRLKRMPSDIYWGALGTWGIRRLDLGITDYGVQSAAQRRQPERDDDGNATQPAAAMWADLPQAPDRFLDEEVDFELSPDEANVVVDSIRVRHPRTLIAVLSERTDANLDADHSWHTLPHYAGRLGEVLHHARCFSELTLGPQLVYSLLLARQASEVLGWNTKELEEQESRRLGEWVQLVEDGRERLDSWTKATSDFRQVLAPYNISLRTLDFWNDMARRAVNRPGAFAEDREVHRLVRERERHLKRRRARLSHTGALENWGGGSAAGQLDYRWSITKRYLQELAAARDGS